MIVVNLTVNGMAITKPVSPRMHLADFVREELNLTGTHVGCEHGVCGACTMMVDGRPVRSCISLAASCHASDVRTIEGFDDDPVMASLRDAFKRHHALQCGYCTPGMLATAYDIVTRLPDADEARVREELSGNLCRCTGYVGIVAAICDVLAGGPHRSRLETRRPPAPTDPTGKAVEVRQVAPQIRGVSAGPLSARYGGVTLSRTIDVPVPVDDLWQTVKRIDIVAGCLPGATIEEVKPDGAIAGAFDVAIGPMRARFGGRAHVSFDDAARRGELSGGGSDGVSRSGAEGIIRFSALPEGSRSSRLAIDLTYRLGGPLAQFGRPAVVEGIVDALLRQFAYNLSLASQGKAVADARPIGGVSLALVTLFGVLRRMFSVKS